MITIKGHVEDIVETFEHKKSDCRKIVGTEFMIHTKYEVTRHGFICLARPNIMSCSPRILPLPQRRRQWQHQGHFDCMFRDTESSIGSEA